MFQNNSKLIEDNLEIQGKHNSFLLKTLFNYIFKDEMVYAGKQNKAFYFYDAWDNQYHSILIIIQQFSLNCQAKIQKKLKINLKNVIFMEKSNYCIAQTDSQVEIWKIDKLYNLNFVQSILTYQNEFNVAIFSAYYSFLLLHEQDNLIITSVLETIYFLKKEQCENWQLQQRIQVGSSYQNAFIETIKLNDQGTILIVSIYKSQKQFQEGSQCSLLVILKDDEQWKIIYEIKLKYLSNYEYCFLDNDEFLIFDDTDDQDNLYIWQILQEDWKVRQLQKQKLKLFKQLRGLKFIKQRGILFAWDNEFIYEIKQNNAEFYISSQIMVPKGLWVRNLIHNEMLVFHPSKHRIGKAYKMKLSYIIFWD